MVQLRAGFPVPGSDGLGVRYSTNVTTHQRIRRRIAGAACMDMGSNAAYRRGEGDLIQSCQKLDAINIRSVRFSVACIVSRLGIRRGKDSSACRACTWEVLVLVQAVAADTEPTEESPDEPFKINADTSEEVDPVTPECTARMCMCSN